MKINILVPSISSLTTANNGANVQGDELIARSWAKYLSRRDDIFVDLNGTQSYDVCISFSPLIQYEGNCRLHILYLQNVFPKPAWPGTIEMFHINKHRYDAFIFPSNGLKQACDSDGLVCQFAVDPELFYPEPYDPQFNFNTCFVGNNIRDKTTTEQYILCAEKYGLAIFGNPQAWNRSCCYGKISIDDERKLYSSSKICLNAHLSEHLEFGSFNFRIFNILACKGFIISDYSDFLQSEFDGCMFLAHNQTEVEDRIQYYLNNPSYTEPYRIKGFDTIINKHTFAHRAKDIIEWIQQL